MNYQIIRGLGLVAGRSENPAHGELSLWDVQRGIDGQFPLQAGEVVAVGPATIRAPQRVEAHRAFCVFYVRVVMSRGEIRF